MAMIVQRLLLLLAALAAVPAARAATLATATMPVSVEVVPNCTLAAQPLAFGTLAPHAAASAPAAAAIDVACGPNVAFEVALDDGRNAAAGSRQVLDPASGRTIAYDIYSDPAHTRRWGASGAQAVAGTTPPSGILQLIAYGRLAAQPQVPTGAFTDTVTVTIVF